MAEAAAAPPEDFAYVVAFDRAAERDDAMAVVDVAPGSPGYGQVVGWTPVPGGGELHHFGWNACSSALAHDGHDMNGLSRRYLLVPGLRSSDIHVLDTEPAAGGSTSRTPCTGPGTTSSTRTASAPGWPSWTPTRRAGLTVDRTFFPHGDDFRGLRVHQVRLQGGDASSDSGCYRS